MSPEAWERGFWGAVETVLAMQSESLESWLGAEDAKAAALIIEQANAALKWAVENRISRCKEDLSIRTPDPNKRQELIAQSKQLAWNDKTWDETTREMCPACGASGFLGGTLWSEEIIDSDFGDPDEMEAPSETVEKTFSVEAFSCAVCGLELYGTTEIAAAELRSEFSKEEIRDMEFEPDYGND